MDYSLITTSPKQEQEQEQEQEITGNIAGFTRIQSEFIPEIKRKIRATYTKLFKPYTITKGKKIIYYK